MTDVHDNRLSPAVLDESCAPGIAVLSRMAGQYEQLLFGRIERHGDVWTWHFWGYGVSPPNGQGVRRTYEEARADMIRALNAWHITVQCWVDSRARMRS